MPLTCLLSDVSPRVHFRLDMRVPVPLRRHPDLSQFIVARHVPLEWPSLPMLRLFNFVVLYLSLMCQLVISRVGRFALLHHQYVAFVLFPWFRLAGCALRAHKLFARCSGALLVYWWGKLASVRANSLYLTRAGRNFILFLRFGHWRCNDAKIDDLNHQGDL